MELTTAQFTELRECLGALERLGGGGEKRRCGRMQVDGKVSMKDPLTGAAHTALMRDLSQSGMAVIQSSVARSGQRLLATLPRGQRSPLDVICIVVETRPLCAGLWAVHMQFDRVIAMP